MRSACDIKDRAAGLVFATSATKSSQPVPANRSKSPPFIYRRATKSTNHRSVKFLDGVQALRGWDGTIFGLSASVSTSSAVGSVWPAELQRNIVSRPKTTKHTNSSGSQQGSEDHAHAEYLLPSRAARHSYFAYYPMSAARTLQRPQRPAYTTVSRADCTKCPRYGRAIKPRLSVLSLTAERVCVTARTYPNRPIASCQPKRCAARRSHSP